MCLSASNLLFEIANNSSAKANLCIFAASNLFDAIFIYSDNVLNLIRRTITTFIFSQRFEKHSSHYQENII